MTSQHTLHFKGPAGEPVNVTFSLADHRIASVRSMNGNPITQPLYMTPRAVSRVIDYLRDLLDGGDVHHHTLRCTGPTGQTVYVQFALMPDGRIAVRRSTGGETLYMAPWSIHLMIAYLRDLQSKAMRGETWDVG